MSHCVVHSLLGRSVRSWRAVLRPVYTATIHETASSTFETATYGSCRSCFRQVCVWFLFSCYRCL